MDRGRAEGRRQGQHTAEVVQVLEDDHDLEDPVNDANSLLEIFGLDNQLFQVASQLLKYHFNLLMLRSKSFKEDFLTFVICLVILSRFGLLSCLSSLVHARPTNSEVFTAR